MIFDSDSRIRLLSGNANRELAGEIANYLGLALSECFVGKFNNGETQVMIKESVRGCDVFIIQPTSQPVNDNVMELLIMADACRRASARSITAVVPYYGYARQDRKTRGREPITAKLMADLMVAAGITRAVTMDLHAGQIQGFFNIPVDHMSAIPLLADYIKQKRIDDITVVSPDLGGVSRARMLADLLHAPIAIIEKRRPAPGVAEVMNIIGVVAGRNAIMVDDIVDTAGSLCEGAKALRQMGARRVYAAATHAVFSYPSQLNLDQSELEEMIVTNTVKAAGEQSDRVRRLSVAPLLGEAIVRIYAQLCMSKLFSGQ
ncbi:MAG: ribose-phosphate pyrophosphokinase [Negativicutes bacterium]|nr:ribose-phosphate pyrophosphokinase [Negativicutes bacterium]